MKEFMIMLTLLVSPLAFAAPVDGKIFYSLPNGEIVKRIVTLDVPARGQGEVILSGDNFEWRTTNFKTIKKNGKTKFVAIFKTEFMQLKSTVVLTGSYVKGTNLIMYYGDMYKKKGHNFVDENLSGFTYSGGFRFSYEM